MGVSDSSNMGRSGPLRIFQTRGWWRSSPFDLVHGFLKSRPLLLAVPLGDLGHLAATVLVAVMVEQLTYHVAGEQLTGKPPQGAARSCGVRPMSMPRSGSRGRRPAGRCARWLCCRCGDLP